VDAIFAPRSEQEDLRSLLNAGYERGNPVYRSVSIGKAWESTAFDAFCPKMLASIENGRLPNTIMRRSVLRGDTRPIGPNPHPVRGIPRMPSWLSTEAKAEWRRVSGELDRLGLLTRVDRGVLARYCAAWALWTLAAKLLVAEGLLAKGQKGEDGKHPALMAFRDLDGICTSLGKELGLSPAARGRMTLPEPETDDPRAAILD
jgi:P27 family predicted phage terminase small subunit